MVCPIPCTQCQNWFACPKQDDQVIISARGDDPGTGAFDQPDEADQI